MKSPTITSERHLIRPFKTSDAKLWQKWDTDPEVQAFMPEPRSKAQDIGTQHEYINECENDEEGFFWSIETTNQKTIGTVALTEFNEYHGVANLGIVIGDKAYWGKGVATEVLTSVVHYAFEHLNIFSIGAEVEEGNIPMMQALEKVGFKQDGLFESARVKNTQRINVYHFGIAKS
jgi:RimJ/RimL family protein N-acetyltransferase